MDPPHDKQNRNPKHHGKSEQCLQGGHMAGIGTNGFGVEGTLCSARISEPTPPCPTGVYDLEAVSCLSLLAPSVTEIASDFATVTVCPFLFLRKEWRPAGSLTQKLAAVLNRCATVNTEPAVGATRVPKGASGRWHPPNRRTFEAIGSPWIWASTRAI
jgi:hypothetical protein